MKKRVKRKKYLNNNGFSLIELIIVIAIMAVLVAVIAPKLTTYITSSQRQSDRTNAKQIENTITYIVQDVLTDDEAEDVVDNMLQFNKKIVKVETIIRGVDDTGEFEEKVKKQLKWSNFNCKREGYNFYMQVFIDDSRTIYEVVCKSVKASDDELDDWSGN